MKRFSTFVAVSLTMYVGQSGYAVPIGETFTFFAENTVLTTQIRGLTISAGEGDAVVITSESPLPEPFGPKVLTHMPSSDEHDYIEIDFWPGATEVAAVIDFRDIVGDGVRFTAYSESGASGEILDTVQNGINISATVDRETVKRCYRSIACAIKGRASSVLELLIDSSLRSRRPHDAQYHGSHCTLQAELDRRTLCDGDCPGLP